MEDRGRVSEEGSGGIRGQGLGVKERETGSWMIKGALFQEELKNMTPGTVLFDEPTDRYTSIGVGGRADVMVFPQSAEELIRVVSYLQDHQVSFIPVGNWTNLIVKDGG